MIEHRHLEGWLNIGGTRIGIGDWQPEKSGEFRCFKTVSIEAVE